MQAWTDVWKHFTKISMEPLLVAKVLAFSLRCIRRMVVGTSYPGPDVVAHDASCYLLCVHMVHGVYSNLTSALKILTDVREGSSWCSEEHLLY